MLVPANLKLLRKTRTGSHITTVYDKEQTPRVQMLKWKDVPEQTKRGLRTTRAEVDMTALLHEVFLCRDQLDEIPERRQPLVIKKGGSYAHISDDSTTPASDAFPRDLTQDGRLSCVGEETSCGSAYA